jgi:hypothetical protein
VHARVWRACLESRPLCHVHLPCALAVRHLGATAERRSGSYVATQWVAAGTAFNSGVTQVTLPLLLGATMLPSAFSRGVGVGCTAHVGGMAALMAAGETAAADAAAVALVVVGVTRSVLVQVPAFGRALTYACGGGESGVAVETATCSHAQRTPPRPAAR